MEQLAIPSLASILVNQVPSIPMEMTGSSQRRGDVPRAIGTRSSVFFDQQPAGEDAQEEGRATYWARSQFGFGVPSLFPPITESFDKRVPSLSSHLSFGNRSIFGNEDDHRFQNLDLSRVDATDYRMAVNWWWPPILLLPPSMVLELIRGPEISLDGTLRQIFPPFHPPMCVRASECRALVHWTRVALFCF